MQLNYKFSTQIFALILIILFDLNLSMASENKFETRDMSDELSDKVRRNNKLTVEIQGAVIITSK